VNGWMVREGVGGELSGNYTLMCDAEDEVLDFVFISMREIVVAWPGRKERFSSRI
jgi:hypothetical protein